MKNIALRYGKSEWKLTAKDLQLIADALEVINPDSTKALKQARKLASGFSSLAEACGGKRA